MLSRFSDALQSAADVLAPPATRLEDFKYHWKMVINFYQNYDDNSKIHIEDTKVPHHLHQMLQLIVEEEKEQQGSAMGPCLEAVVQREVALADALSALVRLQRPPGARRCALVLATALLRRTRRPPLHSPHLHRPLQRMLVECSDTPASPTEKEEVELLLTLCGHVRKEPGLANVFASPYVDDKAALLNIPEDIQALIPMKTKTQTPKKNPLFEVDMTPNPLKTVSIIRLSREDSLGPMSSSFADEDASCKSQRTVYDDNDKFLLIDLLLFYLNSADNQVVLRACEGIMIVFSLPEDDIANLVTCSPACERVVERLVAAFRAVPRDLDPALVDHLNITWACVWEQASATRFRGQRHLHAFFSWLDYCDTLMKECHPVIAAHLRRVFRSHFLEGVSEALSDDDDDSPQGVLLTTALLAKCLRVLDSAELIDEVSSWLVCGEAEAPLHALLQRCAEGRHDLTLEALRFFEVVIEKGTEHSLDRLVLSRVCARHCRAPPTVPLQLERDRLNDVSFSRERERNREAIRGPGGERLAERAHRAVSSFLLLLPRALLSDPLGADYEHYVHDAQRHYQLWLDITSTYKWRSEAVDNTASSTASYDSRPEADHDHFHALHTKNHGDHKHEAFSEPSTPGVDDISANFEEEFDEGPFLRMLFELLGKMPEQPYQVNLHLTAIVSKLALLPHGALHEYLLDPELGVGPDTPTLFKTLKAVARRLTTEVPRIHDYKKIVENTRMQLMSEDPAYDEIGEHNRLVESLIVLEEFCKELAAIAFVKSQHFTHTH